MLKYLIFCLALFSFVLLGCNAEMDCYDSIHYTKLFFLTQSEFDSVQFFINGKQGCYGDENSRQSLCDSSSTSQLLYLFNADEEKANCSSAENVWHMYSCAIDGPAIEVKGDSVELRAKIFNQGSSKEMKMSNISLGGKYINIIPESDSLKWFSFQGNPIRPFFSWFDNPAESKREGCFEGYCIASQPMITDEVCFDK